MSNDGKILTSTKWNQSGPIYISVNGEQTRLDVDYNKYCPWVDPAKTERSVTGCSNTAHSQIIYYWIEQGYKFDLSITSNDYFNWKSDSKTYYCSEVSQVGEGTISEINAILQNTDPSYRIGNGDFIAALNYYCGVKNHSTYGESTSTGSGRTEIYIVSGFDSARARYRSSDHYNPETERFYSTYDFSDVGYSVIRENLDYGEVVQIGISGHAIYLDGYRFNSSTGEYEYHLNYGWGVWSSSTKWYTVQGLQEIYKDIPNKTQGILNIVYDISPDAKVIVSNSRSEYYGGSFLRGMERINHIKTTKSTTFTFADDIAGDTISLSATAAVTSKVDLEFKNFNVTLSVTATAALSSAYAMSFDFDDGAIIVNNNSATKYAIRNTGNKQVSVTLDSSYLYSGYYSSGISALQQITERDNGYVYSTFSSSFFATVSGYTVFSGSAADTVTLTNSSAVFGSLDLGGGKNVLNIENGSLFYGNYLGGAKTLTVNLTINSNDKSPMIVLQDAGSENRFKEACGSTLNVTIEGDIGVGTYTLYQGSDAGIAQSFTVKVSAYGDTYTLNYNNASVEAYTLVYNGGSLSLNYSPAPPMILSMTPSTTAFTNGSVTVTVKFSDNAYSKYFSFDGIHWEEYDKHVQVNSNGTLYFRAENRAGISSAIEKYVVSNIDTTMPTLTVSGNPEAWTNQDAVLKLNAADDLSGVKSVSYSMDDETWNNGTSVKITENGTLYIKVTDNAGNEFSSKVEITNIDKEKPELFLSGNPETWTNQDVTICAEAADLLSGIALIEYSFDQKQWITGSEAALSDNGTVYFRVTDNAGNITPGSITVDKIDKVAPDAPQITADTGTVTNHNVIITVTPAPDAFANEYSTDNGETWNRCGNTVEISENGTVLFRSADEAGNVSDIVSYVVSNIDKIAPDAPQIVPEITGPTNQDVTVYAKFATDSVKNEFSINGGLWQIYTDKVVMTDNGSVAFRSTDEAGNVSDSASYTVSNIDRTPPELPEIKNLNNRKLERSISFRIGDTDDIFEYSVDNENFIRATGKITVYANGNVCFRAIDPAGNITVTDITVTTVDEISDRADISRAFVSSKYSEKTSGKVQNGVTLSFKDNAFTSLEEAAGMYTFIVLADSKNTLSEPLPENIKTIAAKAVEPAVTNKNNTYTYKSNAAATGTLTLAGVMGDAEFIRFSTVKLADKASANVISGGKESVSFTTSSKLKNGISVTTDDWKYSIAAGGKLSATGAEAAVVENYANVTLNGSEVGRISNSTVSYTNKEQNGNSYFSVEETRKESLTRNSSGTLNATGSEIVSVTGFSTVKLSATTAGDILRLSESGESCSKSTGQFTATSKSGTVTGTYTLTVNYIRSGTLTATGSRVGNVTNFNSVTLDESSAATISNERYSQQKYGYTAEWENVRDYSGFDSSRSKLLSQAEKLSGTVTLKNNSRADVVEHFSSVTLAQGQVTTIRNVTKVTVSKGFNTIGSYTGSAGNDTFTINKNAVLALGAVDMAGGTKDKFVNNGTLVLTGDFDRSFISGKGEIVAASDVFENLSDENKSGVLNLGATADGFRT
ncbi:MAG: C10 family peptidase, partial [Lentisphaeria bacterium]|nr:C10 family peptidase [Lentisphaeria bacterium]